MKRMAGWLRQRPWLPDLAVVAAVGSYNLIQLPIYWRDGVVIFVAAVAVSIVLCGAYLFRRSHPRMVLATMLLAASIQLLLGIELTGADLMLVFALYNLASRDRWTVSVPAGIAVLAWLVAAAVPLMRRDWINIGDLGVFALVVVWAWTWGTLVRTRRRYIQSLHDHARQLELQQQVQARLVAAEERTRIARELHDIVAHNLSVVVVLADGAASTVRRDPEQAETAMITVRDTGRSALADMRRTLGVLRGDEPGPDTPQPGVVQLERLVEESRALGMPVELIVQGEPDELPAALDLAVYRVVQEALTNVRKHAGSSVTTVEVAVSYREDELEVSIIDDGRGSGDDRRFDGSGAGHGLIGMTERVEAHGGTVRSQTQPSGRGFAVVAVLPTGGER